MHIKVSVWLSCVVFLVTCTRDNGVYADISCSAGEMPEGEKSEVVCNFGKDIRSSKQTFMVWKYPLNTTTFDSKLRSEVLNCAWNSDPAAQPPQVCIVGEGYSYNYNHNVISTVTVDIDDVTKEQEGIYECQLVSDHSIPSTRCALTVARTYNLACYRKGVVLHCKADDGLIFIDSVIDKLKLEIPDASNKAGGNYMYRLVEGSTWETESSGTSHSLTIVIIVVSITLAVAVVSLTLLFFRLRRGAVHKNRKKTTTQITNDKEAAEPCISDANTTGKSPPGIKSYFRSLSKKSITTESPADVTEQLQGASEAGGIEEEPQKEENLQVDQSDTWTGDQVCQWLTQEGFENHVDIFRTKSVDGKRLLSFSTGRGLWYLGMSTGQDGGDRTRLLEKLPSLRNAVNERKERMKAQENPSDQKTNV